MDEYQSDEVLRAIKAIDERLERQKMTDHDLLINLNAVSNQIVQSLKDIKDSHAAELSSLSTRIVALEQARWMMLGAAGVIGAVAGVLVEIFKR